MVDDYSWVYLPLQLDGWSLRLRRDPMCLGSANGYPPAWSMWTAADYGEPRSEGALMSLAPRVPAGSPGPRTDGRRDAWCTGVDYFYLSCGSFC